MARKKNLDISKIDASEHPDDGGELKPGPGRESFKLAAFWKHQVEMVDQAQAKWIKKGNTIIKRFRDERNRIDEEGQRRMNLLWANLKVMKPAIYSRCPIPVVDRKFLDRDPVGRLSSQMLERSIKNELENGFHGAINRAVYDRLLPGRGVVWIRYEPQFGQGESIPAYTSNGIEDPLADIAKDTGDESLIRDDQEEETLESTDEIVVAEKAVTDYVDWKDFYIFPAKARTWKEVQAIGKKVHISKQEAKERFGEKIGSQMKPDTTPMGSSTERITYSETNVFQDINERSIVVFEIWNKSDLRVYWYSPGYQYLCDVMDDPLELTGFFPVPEPLTSTLTNDTLQPVPDYLEWQDQALQIDELTQRIAMLTKACKVAGAYNAANVALGRILDESVENQLIPVDQWAMFAENGGIKGAIDLLPLDEIQKCIETLTNVRQATMVDLDQVTGLSDIVRGTSDSRETLGGIRLKNNNAGTRLSDSQEDVARFARDAIRIIAEIISKHFSDETLIESSGILFEDELQPDTVLRELTASFEPVAQGQAPQKGAQQQQGQQNPPLALPAPQNAPSPSPLPTPQPQGQNIIPFPGAQPPSQGMPNNPLMGGMLQPQPPDPQVIIFQKIQKAISLLRKDISRGYRIDIETDSTIFGDKTQEREDATEFIGAIGQFMKQFESIATTEPAAMPLLGRMLQWGVRKYRTGRDLESEIDSFVVKMDKKAKQLTENPPPSPEMMKAQAEVEQTKLEGQIQQQNDQRDAQKQAADDQRSMQMEQQKHQLEIEKAQMDMQAKREELDQKREMMQMEIQLAREKHRMEMQKMQADVQVHQQEAAVDIHTANLEHEHKKEELKVDKQALDHKAEANEQGHKLKVKQHEFKMKQQKEQQAAQAKKKKASSSK